jgi:nitrogen fixation protein FixH
MTTFVHRKRTDMAIEMPHRRPSRELTGRTVLICMVAFFAIVAAVNAIMIKAAISTFGGVETDSAFRAGLAYKSEEAAAIAQQAMNWQVDGRLARAPSGDVTIIVDMKDEKRQAVTGVTVNTYLTHPTDARHDHHIVLTQAPDGSFRGETAATPGQWVVTIDVTRGDARIYRSVSRQVLK